ncbi:MAG: L-threonylcarbamoyladenylate synthase [Candidatus Omnitrophica bacterium]|nr:L-threonylcarbamoyladenylate synthase [Candidatus Omnitrophota bacterium]
MKRTIVLKVDPETPDKRSISKAADVIKKGGIVAFPTETVYGLGANVLDKKAVARLYKVKLRPRAKPFTVQISDISALKDVWGCELTEAAAALTHKFWPGPLTIILKSGKGENIGFRMPKHKIALSLIREAGVPVYAPSANLSGSWPPATAGDVLKELDGKIDIVIDGGPADLGVESTVVDLTVKPARILREGAISREILSEIIDL